MLHFLLGELGISTTGMSSLAGYLRYTKITIKYQYMLLEDFTDMGLTGNLFNLYSYSVILVIVGQQLFEFLKSLFMILLAVVILVHVSHASINLIMQVEEEVVTTTATTEGVTVTMIATMTDGRMVEVAKTTVTKVRTATIVEVVVVEEEDTVTREVVTVVVTITTETGTSKVVVATGIREIKDSKTGIRTRDMDNG